MCIRDSNFDNDDGCVEVGNNCVLASCGDGFVQTGVEQCDDGGNQDGDGCSASCESEIGCSQELAAGDVAIIGFNFDGCTSCSTDDEFAIVFLKTVGAGTPIEFTDNGWFADDSGFRTGEGNSTYTTTAKTPAGTIILPSFGSMAFSSSGDQILAYQGNPTSPTFVYALNSEGTTWTDATSAQTSALPLGLVDQATACLLYTSPSPRDVEESRMPSSA